MLDNVFNTLNRLIVSLGITVLGLSTIPAITLADNTNENCNRWGGTCHVKDFKTLHTDDEPNARLLDTIKNAINWILGILATVALCICMYGGFKMLTSGGDTKGYDAGWKVLKNAAIGLAIILLSWMIVSVVFRFVGTLSGGNQTQG